ncbi:MAG: metal ABC transporter ATP-binding protein [Euryarchaeota archaeon]|nr:metal ABC transporter ATP-binding protein [Euryarchaeota archaeon]
MTGEAAPAIRAENLEVRRNGAVVIERAAFSIERGDFVGIVGPNGGGKTTLVQALLGLLPRSKGEIWMYGVRLHEFKDWEKVGYISQDATNYDDRFPLTVRELVGIGLVSGKNTGRPLRAAQWRRVDEELGFMGISDIAKKRVGELSGGQRQRVVVARALVRSPELLVLDEPERGMDATALERFYGKLSELHRQRGVTVLVVSHDLSTVFCRMSRVLCVNRVVYSSPVDGHAEEEVLKKVYGEHFNIVYHRHECKEDFR